MSGERRHMKEKKIRLERDDLARALSVVERIVEAKDKALDPRYGLLLLDVGAAESRLNIVAQNGCQAAISKTTASSESDVRVAVAGKLLIDYVKALPSGGSVTLTAGGKGRKVTSLKVHSGAHDCVIPAHPSEAAFDIPAMDEGETCRAVVPGGLFRSVVQAAASAAKQAEAASVLTGVHIVASESALRVQGCDSLQVVVAYVDLSDGRDGSADRTAATLPSAAVADLVRHVGSDEEVEVVIGERRVAVICEAGEFYLQQVVGRYPDVERLIPSGSNATAVVPNEAFRQSLKAVSVLSRQQRGTNPMRVTVEDSAIVLDYTGPEKGGVESLASGTARMAAETVLQNGSTHAVVDVGFITAHAAAVPSEVDLSVELGGPGSPIAIRTSFGNDAATARLAYVVAPMAAEGGSG